METLTKPLTMEEAKSKMNEFNQIEGVVAVETSEFFETDEESIIVLLSEKLIGKDILEEVNYSVVDNEGETILIKVEATIPEYLLEEE